ncbi:addiction module antidote protein, CC2985 family [Nitrosococcus halophilus Nc 4]|uniref:Antitoxin ParD n=1 Tax=Nitrosococcus halophilus (strain Nc4) TaxID=472759 RepID=D5C0T0_NITHN|nr:type II toxin-antitoxin system ParD family antitoxin [Nitrosococcus halophilus]ADE16403.1 addiction module antidote protein, CC2985 family [Nitrosococcus halophilus Nc 4]
MNVSLTPELEAFVKDRVQSGRYYSASEVIREGLRLLEEQEKLRQWRLEELRKEIQKGLDSGPAEPMDMEEIITEARRELAGQQGKLTDQDA